MGETNNISEVAAKISKDIFRHFGWHKNHKHDDNFECVNSDHLTESGEASKKLHPGDVVFHYVDPYTQKRVFLHTDLKSYGAKSITHRKIRTALTSLCMTIECANESEDWHSKYLINDDLPHEVRGLLFVHNHDNQSTDEFEKALSKVDTSTLPLAKRQIIHTVGPTDIQRLYTIVNDIARLKSDDELPKDYSFHYPDLVLHKRLGNPASQAATIELLASPFITLLHESCGDVRSGYVIYYNRDGATPAEFEYLLDYLSRFQMLDAKINIRIRVTSPRAPNDLKTIFERACAHYVKLWGFDPYRKSLVDSISIDRTTTVNSNYNPGDAGWKK